MYNLFWNLYKSIGNKRTHFFAFGIVLIVVLLWVASSLKFDEDISKLIPSNLKNEKLQKVLKHANFADKIIVNISLENKGSFEDLIDCANIFTDSISANYNDFIKDIKGKVNEETALETIDFVYDNLPFFLTIEDYNSIDSKISKDSIDALTAINFKTLVSPSGFISKKIILKDPLGISFAGLKKLSQLGFTNDFKLKDGFLVDIREKNILLFINPVFTTENTNENQIFVDNLYQLQKHLNNSFNSRVRLSYFGGPLIAVANAEQIKSDIKYTVSIALSVLLLLFIFFYRKLTIPIILFIPTLFGALLAISFLSFIRTEISAISLGIGAVLLGVTLDYSLHILTHLRNNETIESLYKNISKPILMSSLTTALAFLCLLFIQSQALQDLGIFAAISVFGASVCALIFIPLVYKPKRIIHINKITLIDRLSDYKFDKSKGLIGLVSTLLIVSFFTFSKVPFNNDLSKLNYTSPELKIAEIELDSLLNLSSKSLYVIAFGETPESVLKSNDFIYNKLLKFKEDSLILDFNSISALVSSQNTQKRKIDNWNNFWTIDKKATVKKHLIESGAKIGFKHSTFDTFYSLLDKKFNNIELNDYSKITSIPIDDFISLNDNFVSISSIVIVADHQIALLQETFNTQQDIVVIDRKAINEDLLGNLKNDFHNLIIYSLVVILIILLLFYRNLKLTLVTIIPILITWFLTLGLMGLFKLEFNIFSIIISTFIFGLGIDYSIFMTAGLQSQTKNKITTIATFRASIILSVISTILGVGVLLFAKHPALHSLALISIIGITSAMFISFIIQPILYRLFISNFKKEIPDKIN